MSIINKGILDSRTAYLRQVGNDWPTSQVISSSDITEGINLYFTNARVYSNVIASLPSLAGTGMIIQANGQINANAQALSQSLTLAALSPFLTTSNVSEGSNLYYTNARVLSALTGNVTVGNLTATSIVINTSVANSYTTTGNVTAGNINVTSTTASTSKTTGAVTIAGGLGVAGTIYGNRQDITGPFGNIYLTEYTGLYVQKDSGTGMIQLSTDRFANGIGWQVFSATDPAMYSSGNIYFRTGVTLRDQDTTQSGTTPVVIAPTGIFSTGVVSATGNVLSGNVTTTVIQANIWTGLYTANVRETAANLYFTNARVLSALTGGALLNSYVATFRAGIQQTVYNLPLTPISNNYVTVNINGVTQLSNAYTVSGNTLTLSGYPVANADIDVRIIDIAQAVSKDFNSRLFYGNSVANTTVISNNFTDSSILVFENGIAQVPGIDYTASGGVLRFATAPRTGVTVEIRELPTLNGTGTYVGGQNIQVLANGQINATSTVQDQIHPFLLSLL